MAHEVIVGLFLCSYVNARQFGWAIAEDVDKAMCLSTTTTKWHLRGKDQWFPNLLPLQPIMSSGGPAKVRKLQNKMVHNQIVKLYMAPYQRVAI